LFSAAGWQGHDGLERDRELERRIIGRKNWPQAAPTNRAMLGVAGTSGYCTRREGGSLPSDLPAAKMFCTPSASTVDQQHLLIGCPRRRRSLTGLRRSRTPSASSSRPAADHVSEEAGWRRGGCPVLRGDGGDAGDKLTLLSSCPRICAATRPPASLVPPA
jgi:hypothetical protein